MAGNICGVPIDLSVEGDYITAGISEQKDSNIDLIVEIEEIIEIERVVTCCGGFTI